MSKPQKLTKNSKAVMMLKQMLSSGQLSGEEDPKTVWQSLPTFMEHKLSNFLTCYYRLRRQFCTGKGTFTGLFRSISQSNPGL